LPDCVNFISHENSKLTQRIHHTNSQFVRTCLVVNWEQEEKDKAGAFLVEVRTYLISGSNFLPLGNRDQQVQGESTSALIDFHSR
jgi:hypothetical protein